MRWLFETGFFDTLFNFGEPPLSALVWGSILTGFLIQYLLIKKVKRAYIKWIFPTLLLVGIAVCEYLTWVITGWDLLGVCIIYWGILCAAMGAGIAWIVSKLRKGRNGKC